MNDQIVIFAGTITDWLHFILLAFISALVVYAFIGERKRQRLTKKLDGLTDKKPLHDQ